MIDANYGDDYDYSDDCNGDYEYHNSDCNDMMTVMIGWIFMNSLPRLNCSRLLKRGRFLCKNLLHN